MTNFLYKTDASYILFILTDKIDNDRNTILTLKQLFITIYK